MTIEICQTRYDVSFTAHICSNSYFPARLKRQLHSSLMTKKRHREMKLGRKWRTNRCWSFKKKAAVGVKNGRKKCQKESENAQKSVSVGSLSSVAAFESPIHLHKSLYGTLQTTWRSISTRKIFLPSKFLHFYTFYSFFLHVSYRYSS